MMVPKVMLISFSLCVACVGAWPTETPSRWTTEAPEVLGTTTTSKECSAEPDVPSECFIVDSCLSLSCTVAASIGGHNLGLLAKFNVCNASPTMIISFSYKNAEFTQSFSYQDEIPTPIANVLNTTLTVFALNLFGGKSQNELVVSFNISNFNASVFSVPELTFSAITTSSQKICAYAEEAEAWIKEHWYVAVIAGVGGLILIVVIIWIVRKKFSEDAREGCMEKLKDWWGSVKDRTEAQLVLLGQEEDD